MQRLQRLVGLRCKLARSVEDIQSQTEFVAWLLVALQKTMRVAGSFKLCTETRCRAAVYLLQFLHSQDYVFTLPTGVELKENSAMAVEALIAAAVTVAAKFMESVHPEYDSLSLMVKVPVETIKRCEVHMCEALCFQLHQLTAADIVTEALRGSDANTVQHARAAEALVEVYSSLQPLHIRPQQLAADILERIPDFEGTRIQEAWAVIKKTDNSLVRG